MEDEYLTIIEFAALVKLHPNTIRNAIRKGNLSAFQIGSGPNSRYRIAKSEINRIALIDLQKVMLKMKGEK